MTIVATISAPAGTTISNQASFRYDEEALRHLKARIPAQDRPARGPRLGDRAQLGDRLVSATDHHDVLLAALEPLEMLRQVCLRLVDVTA